MRVRNVRDGVQRARIAGNGVRNNADGHPCRLHLELALCRDHRAAQPMYGSRQVQVHTKSPYPLGQSGRLLLGQALAPQVRLTHPPMRFRPTAHAPLHEFGTDQTAAHNAPGTGVLVGQDLGIPPLLQQEHRKIGIHGPRKRPCLRSYRPNHVRKRLLPPAR